MKHTPGPWIVEKPYKEPGIFISAANLRQTNPLVCRVYYDNVVNARLIAAAPEMLEALREMVRAWDDPTPESVKRRGEAIGLCRAAIRKATGD